MAYTIGEMARRLGIAPSALRYYDKEGLLPFIERSGSGVRLFQEKDVEWLQVIGCLKAAGMSIRGIRSFIDLAMQGDETIRERLELFRSQRERVQRQMEALQTTLETLDFKCWYYETAQAAGSMEGLKKLTPEQVPEQYREACRRLQTMPVEVL